MLNEIEKETFWKINFDEVSSLKDVENILDSAGILIKNRQFELNITASDKISALLSKNNLTDKDWEDIKTEYANGNFDLNWDEFMSLSLDRKRAYIKDFSHQNKEDELNSEG
jgi:hypothetical protein